MIPIHVSCNSLSNKYSNPTHSITLLTSSIEIYILFQINIFFVVKKETIFFQPSSHISYFFFCPISFSNYPFNILMDLIIKRQCRAKNIYIHLWKKRINSRMCEWLSYNLREAQKKRDRNKAGLIWIRWNMS